MYNRSHKFSHVNDGNFDNCKVDVNDDYPFSNHNVYTSEYGPVPLKNKRPAVSIMKCS